MKERAAGGWWLQGGDIHRYYVQGGMPPAQPPGGLDWLMGVGCIRELPHLECPHLTLG